MTAKSELDTVKSMADNIEIGSIAKTLTQLNNIIHYLIIGKDEEDFIALILLRNNVRTKDIVKITESIIKKSKVVSL